MGAIDGISGGLITASFLASQPLDGDELAACDAARRMLRRWPDAAAALGPASSPIALFEIAALPLVRAMGFTAHDVTRRSDDSLAAMLRAGAATIALLVVPWADHLDARWRIAVLEAQTRAARWCLLFNGRALRILDALNTYSRRYAEIDLLAAFDDPAVFPVLWRLANAEALTGNGTPTALPTLVARSDAYGSAVCASLRVGVLEASGEILNAIVPRRPGGARHVHDAFEQALTVVYRILFLLFAEARGLVPLWHPVYRESYSVESLRDAAVRPATTGFWDALRAISRLAHRGCRAGDLHVTPFNGRLFAPSRTPLAERHGLDDDSARRTVLALSTRRAADGRGRERIAYRDLGVEQLGAVYETLLDYQPVAPTTGNTRARPRVRLEPGGGVRKSTGTFYTPVPIAEYLVRRTLQPLVAESAPEAILALRVVDPAMGSGAFLVTACAFLAAAYERALVEHGRCHASDIDDAERTTIRRLVAERCLYGVDLNPMAVQLARLSLWLATLAADRPLTFLDHRLLAGDSLLGAWTRDLRRAPQTRRRRYPDLPLFPGDAPDAIVDALPVRFALESTPNDTVDQVRAKERALAELAKLSSPIARWKQIANLWCARWLTTDGNAPPPHGFKALADFVLSGRSDLPPHVARAFIDSADALAADRRFVHWELEFPEVFFAADGSRLPRAGFDVVIGNPPWDMMRADSGAEAERSSSRDRLAGTVRFVRESGVYEAQGAAHANRYQLFVERAIALTRPGGRIGLVLPSGVATDAGSAVLRRHLFERTSVDAIVSIDNHRAVFPIHRSVRFCLLTASAGAVTDRIACRFGIDDASSLDALDPGSSANPSSAAFPVRLSMRALERMSSRTLAVPHLERSIDAAICEKAATLFPRLGSAESWGATFGRELNATDDRAIFLPAGRGLALVEGKHLDPFRVRLGEVTRSVASADAIRRLGAERVQRHRLAYRDVASATNRLTLIAALLPSKCVSTHTVFCLRTRLPTRAQQFLCGLFNSFVLNYLVRVRVTTHVTTQVVENLPVPPEHACAGAVRKIAALARLLSRRPNVDALAELNARVALLYQLTHEEFARVLETFPLIAQDERDHAFQRFIKIAAGC